MNYIIKTKTNRLNNVDFFAFVKKSLSFKLDKRLFKVKLNKNINLKPLEIGSILRKKEEFKNFSINSYFLYQKNFNICFLKILIFIVAFYALKKIVDFSSKFVLKMVRVTSIKKECNKSQKKNKLFAKNLCASAAGGNGGDDGDDDPFNKFKKFLVYLLILSILGTLFWAFVLYIKNLYASINSSINSILLLKEFVKSLEDKIVLLDKEFGAASKAFVIATKKIVNLEEKLEFFRKRLSTAENTVVVLARDLDDTVIYLEKVEKFSEYMESNKKKMIFINKTITLLQHKIDGLIKMFKDFG